MSLRTAAAMAVIPWLFLVAAGLGIHLWDGLIEHYGWPEYLLRFVPATALIYVAVVLAIRTSDRLFGSKTP